MHVGLAGRQRLCRSAALRGEIEHCFVGPIHFVSYSTEESVAVGSPQYNFLAADLAAVNRSLTPWVIATAP